MLPPSLAEKPCWNPAAPRQSSRSCPTGARSGWRANHTRTIAIRWHCCRDPRMSVAANRRGSVMLRLRLRGPLDVFHVGRVPCHIHHTPSVALGIEDVADGGNASNPPVLRPPTEPGHGQSAHLRGFLRRHVHAVLPAHGNSKNTTITVSVSGGGTGPPSTPHTVGRAVRSSPPTRTRGGIGGTA